MEDKKEIQNSGGILEFCDKTRIVVTTPSIDECEIELRKMAKEIPVINTIVDALFNKK